MAALCQSENSWLLAKSLRSKTSCLYKWKQHHLQYRISTILRYTKFLQNLSRRL